MAPPSQELEPPANPERFRAVAWQRLYPTGNNLKTERRLMHAHSIEHWQHRHAFLGARHDRHERRTWLVVALTAVMMIAEIAGGSIFGSMALVADGWHMSTHAA